VKDQDRSGAQQLNSMCFTGSAAPFPGASFRSGEGKNVLVPHGIRGEDHHPFAEKAQSGGVWGARCSWDCECFP